MSWKHFAPVPQDATISFGGYSFVHPDTWKTYLEKVIREDYPDYFVEHLQGRWKNAHWRDQESCILTALDAYLFQVFGILIPDENLFKVFNKDGKGLELPNMLEAISAVIEPLALEIDLVLAVDPEIRSVLGDSDRIIDEKQSDLVAGKPGLCMINVENGYSHAFFWNKIDPRGFKNERFRLVVLIKKTAGEGEIHLSALQGLISFLQYFQDSNQLDRSASNSDLTNQEKIHKEIQELEKACSNIPDRWDNETRVEVDQHLASLLSAYQDLANECSKEVTKPSEQSRILLEAGQMIRKMVRETSQVL